MKGTLEVMIMSGVEDGLPLNYSIENGDGELTNDGQRWVIRIGRREDSDVCLRNDTFVSRVHAYIIWERERWWLEDNNSTNGTYVANGDLDARVQGTIPINPGDLFRIGHTWMRIQPVTE